jgi:hypothetical protein
LFVFQSGDWISQQSEKQTNKKQERISSAKNLDKTLLLLPRPRGKTAAHLQSYQQNKMET